ncbi:ectoine/hydroxyectoine ABC transporter substrate-binding protein EhuB [Actinomycetes bacterium KLBMP 9759]
MLTRRRFLALAGGAVAVAAATACSPGRGGTTVEKARYDGVLRVGIAGERPYGYTDAGGRVTGSQPEVARAALASMGIGGIEAVQVTFDRLIPGLLGGQFDLIAAGMTVTPRRCGEVAFSRPDFLAAPAFLVRKGNPSRITTFSDVARSRVKLGVLAGSAERDYALGSGVRPDRIVELTGQGELVRAVADRSVTAAALTAISLADELRRNPDSDLAVTAPTVPIIDATRIVPAGAFAMRAQDTDLRAELDEALAALQASGEWLRITAPFGFTAENLPPPDLTTDRLCGRG